MGVVDLSTDCTEQRFRYVLPIDGEKLRTHILGMLERPEQWKDQHERDYGRM